MNILVFGGNGFLGSSTVENILKTQSKTSSSDPNRLKVNIILVNRGSWPWTSKLDIKPYVKCIYCDRKKPLVENKDLVETICHNYFDYVIDFSAYSKEVLSASVRLLEGKVGLYIFISSDSVYEVCEINHSLPSRENDSQRPNDTQKQKQLKKLDSYGHKKLECEEILLNSHSHSNLNYLILRLADIIGPKDSTDRWWTYQLWLELSSNIKSPVLLPKELENKTMNFVYSEDVACLIHDIIFNKVGTQVTHNEVYNLACREVIKLDHFLMEINKNMNQTKQTISVFTDSEGVPWIFPSVSRGPIDISKATACLMWEPTPIPEVIKRTTKFFEQVKLSKDYRNEKEEIIETVVDDLAGLFEDKDIQPELEKILFNKQI